MKEAYVCRIPSVDEIRAKWEDEISRHTDKSNWLVWTEQAEESFLSGKSIPYYGFKDGICICEATAVLSPSFDPRDSGMTAGHIVELCAFRTVKEYRANGYFSKLLAYMLDDLKRKGYDAAVVGVEPHEVHNKTMYRHWGFTCPAGTGTETYPDGTVIEIEFYGRPL